MAVIRVIDFETTGFEPPEAQVCEVGICDVDTDTKNVGQTKDWLCKVDVMPPEVRAVHHISLSDCADMDAFTDAHLYDGADAIAAHNMQFEAQFIKCDLPMICTYKSALRVWPDAPTHSNGGLRYWLEDQGLIAPDNVRTQPAHRAGPDAYVTAWLVVALMNAGATGKQMVEWTKEPKLLSKCTIGKFRGKPWSDVDAGFLGWMLRQPDMDSDLKWNAAREMKARAS